MHQHGQHFVVSGVAHARLFGAHDAFHHWVGRLKMARVRRERNFDLASAGGALDAACAEVILHITGALRRLRIDVTFKFAEDLRHRLADQVREHRQSAAVRHANDHLAQTLGGSVLH